MKLKPNFLKITAFALVGGVLGMACCKEEDNRITLQDTADVTEEAITDSYFQDMDDMAGVAVASPSESEYSSGRMKGSITIEDHRFNCEGIVVTLEVDAESTVEVPMGVLTIDFGATGCEDLSHNIRKGKLIFTYHGRRFMPESSVVITTENYSINNVILEGTRTLTNRQNSTSDAPRFNVVLTDGKATFSNATTATRESNITWQWNRAANPLDDNLTIEMTSSASGTTRGGRAYEVSLLEDLVYKRHCGIAVSGVKKYVINGTKEISIDYGDGTCDRSMEVTINGKTRNITL
jgi:hypothetical protein